MSNADNDPSTSSEQSLGDDGRSLWWAIPAAVATVLGVAGAVIARSRRVRPVRFPDRAKNPEIDEFVSETTSVKAPPVE